MNFIELFIKQICVVLTITLFFCNNIFAQDSIIDQDVRVNKQFWFDYNFNNSLTEALNISTQVGYRKITPKIYNRFLGISTLNIKNNKKLFNFEGDKPFIKSFHLGAGIIYTQNNNNNDNFELRLIQGIQFEIPTIKPVTLNNYIRIEERFQNTFQSSGWQAGFRLRYRMSTVLSLKNHYVRFTNGLYIPLEAEVFVNLKRNERFNDLIRLSPGLGYKLDNNWKFELYLIFNSTKNITETNNKSNDFILRLRVFNAGSKKQEVNTSMNED